MRNRFFVIISSVLSVIGSVVGAGFITGKEVNAFFGKDLSAAGLYAAFLLFTLAFFAFMKLADKSGGKKFFSAALSIGNIVVSACMVAAINAMVEPRFGRAGRLAGVIAAFAALAICNKGVGAIAWFSTLTMPIVTAFLVAVFIIFPSRASVPVSPSSAKGAYMPILYVGINTALSSSVVGKLGEKLSVKEAVVTALTSSVVLMAFIFFIALKTSGIDAEIPVLTLVSSDERFETIAYISMFFAIFSTLLASLSSATDILPEKKKGAFGVALTALIVCLSFFGFSDIVEKGYPAIGVFGLVYLAFIAFSRLPFRSGRLSRTSRRQDNTKRRCSPLRDRV